MHIKRARKFHHKSAVVSVLSVVFHLGGCGIGVVHNEEPLGECPTEGCPPSQVCLAGVCTYHDPCLDVSCGSGESCIGGFCIAETPDSCAGIECSDPEEVCSGGLCVDAENDGDGDGFQAREDCNDWNPDINPAADESCNGVDDNCNDTVDEGFDGDNDGYSTCGSGHSELIDCDDTNDHVFPGAPESCNNVDDDCNGTVDDSPLDVGVPCGTDVGECRLGTLVCSTGIITCQGGVDPLSETCDNLDNDCDGDVDNGMTPRSCVGACGTGIERCVDGAWVCDAPTTGECIAGETEERECDCGTKTKTCDSSCNWSDWSHCSGRRCAGEEHCCEGVCLFDIDNCFGCGEPCPSGSRGSCCVSFLGDIMCCSGLFPFCSSIGICSPF